MLLTKLYKPPLSPDLIFREDLIQRLNKNRHKPFTLVSAPSGYGKSIVISQWIDYCNINAAWLSLDKEHQDIKVFLKYVVAALESRTTNNFSTLKELIEGQQLPSVERLYESFVNIMDQVDESVVFILDDYQMINNANTHQLMDMLITYPLENLHLVIICRHDPPLQINKLRLYNRLNEIRMSDLEFNLDQTRNLVSKKIGEHLSDQQMNEIHERTEGWVLGLQMILMTDEIQKIHAGVKSMAHYTLREYSEVFTELLLKRFSDAFKETLFISSILKRFNKELIEYLIQDIDISSKISGSSFIADLVKNNLFIYRLDDEGVWYRYHHFFGEMLAKLLQQGFSNEQIAALHIKASLWFDENDFLDEAYQHALESGDVDLAVNLIEKNRYNLMNSDQFERLRKLIEKLPKGAVEEHLEILLTRAILREVVYDFSSMEKDLKIADKLVEKINPEHPNYNQLMGEYHTGYACMLYNIDKYEEAFSHSKLAVSLLQDPTQYISNFGLVFHLFSLNALGKFDDAIAIVSDSLKKLPPSEEFGRLLTLLIMALINAIKRNLNEINKLCQEAFYLAEKNKLWVSMIYGSYYIGEINYQRNNLEEAVKYAKTLGHHYYQGRAYWVLPTLYVKAFSYHALGQKNDLSETIAEIDEVTETSNIMVYNELTKAFKVDLALRQGDIIRALNLSKNTNFNSLYLDYTFYFQQLTQIRLLILADYDGNRNKIEELINKYIEIGRNGHKYNLLMQVLLLQSIHFIYQNDMESAIASLKESIDLAQPGGFIRIFVDLGEPMKELLEEYRNTNPGNNFIDTILDAFSKELPLHVANKELTAKESLKDTLNLSKREIELIQLVSQGYRNKEIADSLFISIETVKSHIKNSLRKLDAKNRVDLVQKARVIEIID